MSNSYQVVIIDSDTAMLNSLKCVLECSTINFNTFCFNKINDNFYGLIKKIKMNLFIVDVCMNNVTEIIDKIIQYKKDSVFLFIYDCDNFIEPFSKFSGKYIFDFISKPIDKEIFINRVLILLNSIIPTVQKVSDKQYFSLRNHYKKLLKNNRNLIENFKDDMDKEFAYISQGFEI